MATDLDGILAHTGDELRKRVAKEFKVDTGDIDVLGFVRFFEEHELDQSWLHKQWLDEWLWARAVPNSINVRAILSWQERGHEIHVITARAEKETALVTRAWLRKHGIPIKHLTFQPLMHKINYIKANDIPVMFEDMFFEANKIASFGVPCFVVNRPWNVGYKERLTNPLVQFIDDLTGADYFIKERENV